MFSPQSHSGFYRTTIAKCFLALIITFSFVLSMPFAKYKSVFTYDLKSIFEEFEIWRLFPSHLAFLDLTDMIFGGLLLYYFRIFERRYGPTKFMSYLLCTGSLSVILEMTGVAVMRTLGIEWSHLPSGPYNIIFPLFVPYYIEIPRVAFTHILGVPVTGKSFPYIMGLQIASSSKESMLVSFCGLLSGLLYHWNFLFVRSWFVFPKSIVAILARSIGKYLQSPAPANIKQPIGATLEIQRQEYMERLEQQLFQTPPGSSRNGFVPFGSGLLNNGLGNQIQNNQPIVASEEKVQQLVEMGFPRNRAVTSLENYHNDINLAMNSLLQSTSGDSS